LVENQSITKNQLLVFAALFIVQISFPSSNLGISQPPTVAILYNSPFCNSTNGLQPVTINGTGNYTVGTYSSSPAGLAINPTTGSITPSLSIAGTYAVNYTIPAGTEPEVQTTTVVQIVAQSNAGSDGSITICAASMLTVNLYDLIVGEQVVGTWIRTTGTGGSFNANLGTYIAAPNA